MSHEKGVPCESFYPGPLRVPEEARTERIVLRPLRATDVDRDYAAVMSSAPELRRWSASDWPADGFTLAENLADLERHEREHAERKAFTYTVIDPEGTRCLGCVYIVPVWPEAATLCGDAACAACVGFWVRASELTSGLDHHLLVTLLEWLRAEWSFNCVLFTTVSGETRQPGLFGEAGLERFPLSWPDGRDGSAFRATWKRRAAAR